MKTFFRSLLFLSAFLFCGNVLLAQVVPNEKLKKKIEEATLYCKAQGINQEVCILADLSIPSGKKRIYLVDLSQKKILASGMCSHGCGSNPWGTSYTKEKPVFSNTPDSHCSSLGKFHCQGRGYSAWGIHVNYKMVGKESTNSNAYKREIVLHSWDDVPETEVYPAGIPEGWGCPAVNNAFMTIADSYLKKSGSPVLLWIYN